MRSTHPFRRLLSALSCASLALPIVAAHAQGVVIGGSQGTRTHYSNTSGDVWDSTWGDDGNVYTTSDDSQGWTSSTLQCNSNFLITQVTGSNPAALSGQNVNCMSQFGTAGQANADGSTWKATSITSIGGVLTVAFARQFYGDPQTSYNATFLKSTNHGSSWQAVPGCTDTLSNCSYNQPVFPSPTYNRFASPFFIEYGQNGTATADGADSYVYALSNYLTTQDRGSWQDSDELFLGRVARTQFGDLLGSEWQFYTGGDGRVDSNWSSNIASAIPILSQRGHLGMASATYDPGIHRYLMPEWWFPAASTCDYNSVVQFYESPAPWGPWTPFSELQSYPYGYYNPDIVSKFLSSDGLSGTLFVNGSCKNSEYALNTIPLTFTTHSVNVATDTTSQGAWMGGRYGNDGSQVVGDVTSYPGYAQVSVLGSPSSYTWTSSTQAPVGLQKPSTGGADRIEAALYSFTNFAVDMVFTDQRVHRVSAYMADFDSHGRQQRVDLVNPSNGDNMGSVTVTNFAGGTWASFYVEGHEQLVFTNLFNCGGGCNAVLSGLFFDTPAQLTGTDTTTQGNWSGVYGSVGVGIVADTSSFPAWATVTVQAAPSTWIWQNPSTDARALQKLSNTSQRIMAAYYSATNFSYDVNLDDGLPHTVSVYMADYDTSSRNQEVDVVDAATGQVLDFETLANFGNGVYFKWKIQGHVQIRFTNMSAVSYLNSVASGIFID